MAFLTIEQRGGKRGHGREAAGTKAAQEEGIAGRYVTARGCRWPRWCSLSVPFGNGEARSAGGRWSSTVHPR
jgi:hypothetical protein